MESEKAKMERQRVQEARKKERETKAAERARNTARAQKQQENEAATTTRLVSYNRQKYLSQ
jgi:hypothetical protein